LNAERSPASRPCERRIATAACYQLRSHERLSVTVDSPEKQRVGIVAQCHGAVGQDWPPEMPAMRFATPSAGAPNAAAALGWPFVFAAPILRRLPQTGRSLSAASLSAAVTS
jgi:hypothetical protein